MGIKWIIKKSDFTEIRKSVSKEADSKKLEQLKKEVIAILEKKDSQEYKKAIEYFEETEIRYSHLEKSISGDWIEKAGYGVGTVRIWRGKKYKKVSTSPVKWVRVFDKHDRGAATSMGKYIAQVKKCETVEELYQFCMKQRSLFQDENGVDLPIMDKLRAAIESQGNKLENTDKREKINNEYMKEDLAQLKAGNYAFDSFADFKAEINRQAGDRKGSNQPNYIGYLKLSNDDYLKKLYDSMPKAEKYDDDKAYEEYQKLLMKENPTDADNSRIGELVKEHYKHSKKEWIGGKGLKELNAAKDDSKVLSNGKTVKEVREQYGVKVDKKETEKETYWIKDKGNNRITSEDAKNKIKSNLSQIDAYNNLIENSDKADAIKWNSKKNQLVDDNEYLMDRLNPDDRKEMETEQEKHQNRSDAMKGNQNAYKGGTEENKTKTYKTIPSFEPVDSTKAKKKNIAETTKVADGKVTIPATREIKNEIKSLLNNLDKSPVRPFMNHVYYDGENMVATDGKTLKTIKIGAIDGIEPNKYLKIDTSGKENITIEQDNENYGNFPSYKRVIPENNNQKINLNNSILKDKIEDMKKDGSIDMDIGKITLKLKDGNVYLDDVIVGSAPDVIFENNEDYINFNYKYLTNALQGNNSILAVSENNQKAMSISTSVSDNVIMPLIGVGETDYSANRTIKEESDKINAKVKAEKEAVAEERKKRSITDEAKSDILKNKPEGVTDRDYEDLIDYTNDFYTKLGYDNSSERAKRQIKETVDNAIKKINNKDFDILESIINTDNKVSRRIFQTLTAIPLGSNQADAKKAWEKWVGHDAMKKYRDDENTKIQAEKNRVAAEKKAKEEAENEQYNGFLSSKTPAGRAKAMEILNKKGGFNGKVMTWQELADKYIAEGGHARSSTYITSGGKEKPYYSISNKDGLGYEVPKTVYDYAMHISNGVKKSIADIIMLDEYEHEDFDEDFEDFDASQPDLFNSPAYKVSAALDSVFGCR